MASNAAPDEGSVKGRGAEIMLPPEGDPFNREGGSGQSTPRRRVPAGPFSDTGGQGGDGGSAPALAQRGVSKFLLPYGRIVSTLVVILAIASGLAGGYIGYEQWQIHGWVPDWVPAAGLIVPPLLVGFLYLALCLNVWHSAQGEEKSDTENAVKEGKASKRGKKPSSGVAVLIDWLGDGQPIVGWLIAIFLVAFAVLCLLIYKLVYLDGGGSDWTVHLAVGMLIVLTVIGLSFLARGFFINRAREPEEDDDGDEEKGGAPNAQAAAGGSPKSHGK